MDRIIATLPARADGDLALCLEHGIAYQVDRAHRVEYDAAYFSKCRSYEDQEIATAINRGRIEMVAKHFSPVARCLDVGIGSGEFVRKRPNTWGYDVNPVAQDWLKERRRWVEPKDFGRFWAFTMFDVLEHVETPADYLGHIPDGGWLFVSLPIFDDLTAIRASRHYRPGEHLQYFTEPGFVAWIAHHGFKLVEREDFETRAGRNSILSFAFVKS